MAGSYPDTPGYRFAYDRDGTIGFKYTGSLSTMTQQERAYLNAEAVTGASNLMGLQGQRYFGFIFPEPRRITGIWMTADRGVETTGFAPTMQWSNTSTNGADGTWATGATNFGTIWEPHQTTKPYYRSSITTVDIPGVTALRFFATKTDYFVISVHIYGTIGSTESPHRLRIIDLNNDEISTQFDFGNIAQRATVTKQFRIINNSPTMTAQNITVSLQAPTNATPTLIGQLQVSTDNVGFANAVNIGDLAPSASSGILYIKNAVAPDAQLGVWTARVVATPVSWS